MLEGVFLRTTIILWQELAWCCGVLGGSCRWRSRAILNGRSRSLWNDSFELMRSLTACGEQQWIDSLCALGERFVLDFCESKNHLVAQSSGFRCLRSARVSRFELSLARESIRNRFKVATVQVKCLSSRRTAERLRAEIDRVCPRVRLFVGKFDRLVRR